MVSRRRTSIVATLLALTVLLLAACGGTEPTVVEEAPEAGDDPDTGSEDEEAEETSDDEPRVLRMAIGGITDTLDPSVYRGRPTNEVANSFASPLFHYEASGAGSALQGPDELRGELAADYEEVPEGLRITLREAQSPYGNSLTSADVEWTFERAVEMDFIARFLLGVGGVDTENPVDAVDERTVVINADVNALTGAVLTWYSLGILDSQEAEEHATADDPWAAEWLEGNIATFGPYTLDSFDPGQELRLVKNPNYWQDCCHYDQVVIRAVPDSSSRHALIETGEVDFVSYLEYAQFQQLQENPSLQAIAAPDSTADVLGLNHQHEPFADERVREAISLAIDRDALVESAYAGIAEPALYPISTAVPHPELPEPHGHDTDRAQELLAEAGYEDLSFELAINTDRPGPHVRAIAETIQAQLADIGVSVQITAVPSASEYDASLSELQFEAFIFSDRIIVVDPAYYLALYYASEGVQNLTGYSNDEIDELTTQALTTPDGPERQELLARAYEILQSDLPWIPLAETPIPWVFGGDITGVATYPTGTVYPAELGE